MQNEDPRHLLGRLGERIAAQRLKRERFRVLYRNFRPKGGGEVDIVCRDLETSELVFVEVKTRSKDDGIRPSDAVNRDKQYLITRGALAWLRMLGNPEIPCRFDVVEVVMDGSGAHPDIHIIRDAFPLPSPYIY